MPTLLMRPRMGRAILLDNPALRQEVPASR